MASRILLVDDNDTVRTLLKISLKKEGYELFEARDGIEGFEKANKVEPDLIISDILMPNMDGFEFCRKIREESSIKNVPFIFLSSLAEISTESRGYRTGVDDYLVKSDIKKEELVNKIEELLKKSSKLDRLGKDLDNGLVGRLAETPLVEIVQILVVNGIEGGLKVTEGEDYGEIFIKENNIYHAQIGNLAGEKAVHRMVLMKNGIFRFFPEKLGNEVEHTVFNSAMNIIMDCCRILDEERKNIL